MSTARAVAFAQELFIAPEMDENRFQIVGHADKQPLIPNTDDAARERNRRVEIVILKTHEYDDDDQPEITPTQNDIDSAVNSQPEDFELNPNEIF